MTARPRVSILVLGYNRFAETTALALASLHDDPDVAQWQVVVVDNASDEANRAAFVAAKARWPGIELHHLPVNRGYPGGMNACLARATGEIFILVSSDIIVPRGMVGRIVEAFDANPSAGLIAPVTNFAGNAQQVWIDPGLPVNDVIARGLAYANATDGGADVLAAYRLDFCCVGMRRSVYDEVGPLDEAFIPGYFEDFDYSLRARAAGFDLLIAERAFVYHEGGGTFGRMSDAKRQLANRNRTYFLARHGAATPMPHERDANAAMLEAYADAAAAGTPPSPTRVANRLKLALARRPKGVVKRLRYLRRLSAVRKRLAPFLPRP
ncbi:MAG: glycosyltransferase [Gemmatimonadetes bacterium]|nr:glycosyltransferase [Gemmatimonadota bacterium]